MKLPVAIITLIFLCILFAGCTTQPPAQPATTAPTQVQTQVTASIAPVATPITDPLLLGTWNLKSMALQGGSALTFPMNVQITANFDNQGNLNGWAGCNNYNAYYTLSGQQLYSGQGMTVEPIASTKTTCDAQDTETNYLQVLQKAKSYVVNGDGLTITDNLGSMLVYQR